MYIYYYKSNMLQWLMVVKATNYTKSIADNLQITINLMTVNTKTERQC